MTQQWDEALKRIKEAKETKAIRLDLSRLKLGKIPKQLEQLTSLQKLDLSGNRLTSIKRLAQHHKLEHINLSYNKIKYIAPLAKLTSLKILNISNNKVTQILPLSKLIHLTNLELASNYINTITALAGLNKLRILDISHNSITNINVLCRLGNLKKLSARYNKVSEITGLEQLKKLTYLNLNNNDISNVKCFRYMPKLTDLILNNNKIKTLESLGHLKNLYRIELDNNDFTDINITPLEELENLKTLSLCDNHINHINSITQLKNLVTLWLNNNPLKNIKGLSKLKKIRNLGLGACNLNMVRHCSELSKLSQISYLHLNNNQLIDLAMLKDLTGLNELHLRDNRVNDLKPLSQLKELNTLTLDYNQITNIEPISSLKKMRFLYLSNNQINNLSSLASLEQLYSIDISKNQITDLTPVKRLIRSGIEITINQFNLNQNILINDNPLETPPLSIIEKGNEAILKYFDDIEKQGADQLNEAKLIIVGEPEAGKSTLMEKLFDANYQLDPNAKSTLGVDVREGWEFKHPTEENRTLSANIWDFGGQQIQYMTHQFFLTPEAVYVLVAANDRKESSNFPYWFKIIHLLGEIQGRYSPVLVVNNKKSDKFHFDFDLNYYQKRYPELQISVQEVNLANCNHDFMHLRDTIQKMLSKLPLVNDPRPARWKDIRQDLRVTAKHDDYINFDRYQNICTQHQVNEEDSQKLLSNYLHSIGSLLHFVDDMVLRDCIILKPQWAVDAVYSVLVDTDISNDKGRFKQQKLDDIWHEYSINERSNLLNLMKQENFEICYPLQDQTDTFICPQLLPDTRPTFEFDASKALTFRFQYQFMPDGIITRLIVRLNKLIMNDLVWKKGVLLQEKNCKALVLEEEDKDGLKVIDISVTGDTHKKKYLLHTIRHEIQKIHHKWFKNIRVEQMIPCICPDCQQSQQPQYYSDTVLEKYQNRGKATIECQKHIEDVDVQALLEGVFTRKEMASKKQAHDRHRHTADVHFHHHIDIDGKHSKDETPQSEPNTHKPTTKHWYQQWWGLSLIAALITLVAVWFWSQSYMLSCVSAASIGYFVYTLNPKRRYFRLAYLTLVIIFPSANPNFSLDLGFGDSNALWINLQSGQPLHTIVNVAIIILVGWFALLDSKMK